MKSLIAEYLLYGDLEKSKIEGISGAMIDGKVGRLAGLTYEEDIPLGTMPKGRIIKMSQKKYVDEFFDTGSIQLGNFEYYNQYEHEEIGDRTEGRFILVGRCPGKTGFTSIAGGFNYHVFCAYEGEPDPECIAKFNYDSYFEIKDVKGFSDAISKALASSDAKYASCIYRKDKALVGSVPSNFPFMSISPEQLKFFSEAKYFLKPERFSHQQEFRFIWDSIKDLTSPITIKCPEAIQYCEWP
jgi:hypothetical protein